MAKYKISSDAEADLIRIHHYGIRKFGMNQADKYFNDFQDCFELIAKQPFAFE
jgi:toxin ParE1/3/4